jgi:hypothetical protein
MYDRLAFPLPVKRQLRQESGFGCCKCGRPIIEYHHIVPYTQQDPHFRPHDMMCLCPYCHHEATVGAMTEAEQRILKANPINIKNGQVGGLLKINQKLLILSLGNNEFINDRELITIDEENIIELTQSEEGAILLSLKLYDAKNNLLLKIEENEWVSGDYLPWDIDSSFQFLKIRQKKGKIILDIDVKGETILMTGNLFYNGLELQITKDRILSQQIDSAETCFVGCSIKFDTNKHLITLAIHPIYNQAKIVKDITQSSRISKGLIEFEILKTLNKL